MILPTLLMAPLIWQASALEFVRSEFETNSPKERLALVDMTGDAGLELVLFTGFGIQVLGFDPSGQLQPAPLAVYLWDAPSVAWTLVDVDGDGVTELLTYEGAELGRVHRLRGDKGFEHSTILKHKADIPSGVYRMDFLRDINGDGRQDIVLPQLGKFAIFLQSKEGTWAEPLMIEYQTRVDLDVGAPQKLDSEFGQDLRVPWFELRDVDGDGLQDLISKTPGHIHFHLANPGISAAPSWTLNLAALQAELPKQEGTDFDNLLGQAARGVEWKLADLDGELPDELILRVGSKFRIYKGGSRSGPVGAPSQVLKSSGNVLFFVLRDVLGDSAPELQILRGEKIGVGQVIRWLVLPGSIDFDVFTYANQAGEFSRRPTRRNKLVLGIPRILAFAERMEDLSDERDELAAIPTLRIALDADSRPDDILDVVGDQLLLFGNAASADALQEDELDTDLAINGFLKNHVDGLGESGSKSFDLGDVEQWISFAGSELRASCAGKAPSQSFSLGAELSEVRIRTLDLNQNGRMDFIVLGHPSASETDSEASPLWKLHFFIH